MQLLKSFFGIWHFCFVTCAATTGIATLTCSCRWQRNRVSSQLVDCFDQ